jgi:hypothetical protein
MNAAAIYPNKLIGMWVISGVAIIGGSFGNYSQRKGWVYLVAVSLTILSVGKTSLISQFVNGTFHKAYQPTVRTDIQIKV